MSRLPPLGEFDFLRSCTLKAEQAEELSALAERWQSLVNRWGNPEAPGAFKVPPEDGIAFHNEYLPLRNALHAFGVRHGFITEPKQASPRDPVKEVREAIRLHRGILDGLRNIPAHFQGGIDKLWELWRDCLPEHGPPTRTRVVADRQQALDATDALQRELNCLYPLASNQAAGRDETASTSPSLRPAGPSPRVASVPANPFRDYAQYAWQICEEERQRDLSPNRLRRPVGEMQKHVTEREIEL
jgi:hypothetical protein